MLLPDLSDIQSAYSRIKPFIHRTPVMSSQQLNRLFGCELYFKCENFQKTGSFKFRGAMNAVLSLTEEKSRKGVLTHSSGNHAAALALAASMNRIKANIVMPGNAPFVKREAVINYGAEVTICKPTLADRGKMAQSIIKMTGATLIHPYDNFDVICGQGTAVMELLEEESVLDVIIAPVGGGGLISGTSTYVKAINSNIEVIAAEPLNANDAYISFTTGVLTPAVNPITVADGLLTSLSELTFEIIRKNVDNIFTAHEKSIIECMLLVWERMKIVIEPSSATVLAVIKENRDFFENKRIGLIISGGNLDFRKLPY